MPAVLTPTVEDIFFADSTVSLLQIWDLRTGTIYDAFAYSAPITSMQFDARRIVAAAGEDVVKVYDRAEGRQWDCGAGVHFDTSASTATLTTNAGGDAESEGGSVGGEAVLVGGEGVTRPSVVERVRIKEGFLVEGRRDGVVGVWSC